jgi:hypothetical protein
MYICVLQKTFAEEGLQYSMGGDTGNTRNSHRLLAWAADEHGLDKQNQLAEALFNGYFCKVCDRFKVAKWCNSYLVHCVAWLAETVCTSRHASSACQGAFQCAGCCSLPGSMTTADFQSTAQQYCAASDAVACVVLHMC